MSSERDKNVKRGMDRRAFLNRLNSGTLATGALMGSLTKAWAAKEESASGDKRMTAERLETALSWHRIWC